MPDLHPPLSAFPFVLMVLLVLNELRAVRWGSRPAMEFVRTFLLTAAILICPATFLSGYWAASLRGEKALLSVEGAVLDHELFAKLFMLALASAALLKGLAGSESSSDNPRIRYFRAAFLLCLFVSLGLASYTGYLGGRLVFQHSIGVLPAASNTENHATSN